MDTKTKENIPVKTTSNRVTKSPWPSMHEVSNLEKVFEQIFGNSFPALFSSNSILGDLSGAENFRVPKLDMIDRDNELIINAEIPGIKKEDINISIADNVLTIKGDTSAESNKEDGDYYRHEISKSSFARSMTLPCSVDESKVVANLNHGVLKVKLPKLESSKRKNIKIQ